MPKKRERLEVIFDILTVIKKNKNSIRPTKLLHDSNLSPQMFSDYRKELFKKNFILEFKDESSRIFFTLTEKGFKYLEEYKSIMKFISSFGL